jgi:hypothetical protein
VTRTSAPACPTAIGPVPATACEPSPSESSPSTNAPPCTYRAPSRYCPLGSSITVSISVNSVHAFEPTRSTNPSPP